MTNPTFLVNPNGIANERFGNEMILINLLKGNYYSFREHTAIFIWDLLAKKTDAARIVAALIRHYEVEEQQAAATLNVFLEQLLGEELILSISEEATAPTETADQLTTAHSSDPGEPLTRQAFTPPLLEVYDDMQELIMLDPVHDVDAVKGWPNKK